MPAHQTTTQADSASWTAVFTMARIRKTRLRRFPKERTTGAKLLEDNEEQLNVQGATVASCVTLLGIVTSARDQRKKLLNLIARVIGAKRRDLSYLLQKAL